MKLLKLWLLITVLTLPACSGMAAGGPSSAAELTGTPWTLVSMGTAGAETPVIEGSMVTLEFKTDGQAGGSGGCNSYGGGYQVQGDTLSFDQLNSTLMACADEGMMQQETEYFQALDSAGRFEVADNRLTIWYNGGQDALNFSK